MCVIKGDMVMFGKVGNVFFRIKWLNKLKDNINYKVSNSIVLNDEN